MNKLALKRFENSIDFMSFIRLQQKLKNVVKTAFPLPFLGRHHIILRHDTRRCLIYLNESGFHQNLQFIVDNVRAMFFTFLLFKNEFIMTEYLKSNICMCIKTSLQPNCIDALSRLCYTAIDFNDFINFTLLSTFYTAIDFLYCYRLFILLSTVEFKLIE